MKEFIRKTENTEIVYEITKEELEMTKKLEREKGRQDVIGYLAFSLKNYRYELNLKGLNNLVHNLVDFLSGKTNTIENLYGYSFYDYIKYVER